MEKKFILYPKTIACFAFTFIALFLSLFTAKTYAQINCNNPAVLFLETFGTGTTATSSPDVIAAGLTYQETGPLNAEGVYRIINNTQQKPEWHASEDHTANDVDGKMLVANGQAETYYSHQIDRTQGFAAGNYSASLYIMNVNTPGTCGATALLPNITFRVEYLSLENTWAPLTGSPYTAAPVVQSATPTWVAVGASFTLPSAGAFVVTSIRLVLTDGTIGGCGNDFAMDDVNFSLCPEGGPLPVEFLDVTARQKDNGVNVEWSTSQEINSSRFDVEKSADGNDWNIVSSINAAGNSSIVKNYSAYDAAPFGGVSFYRIKEVDEDGNFKYSKTVRVKLNFNTTGVSVLSNPFHNSLTVNFTSSVEQAVSARLIDITGKQVAVEKWSVTPGNTKKEFSNVSGLQQGMYILSVSTAGGEVLYNNKVIKQ